MNPADDFFTGTSDAHTGSNPIDGRNVAWINEGGQLIYQDPQLVVQTNLVYTLRLLAGQRIGVAFGDGLVRLLAGTNLLAQGIPAPPSGIFTNFSLSFTSPPSGVVIGAPLSIELNALTSGSQTWWDNVHLSTDYAICTPHKARAVAQLYNGIFVGATILDTGCGYTNVPAVAIQGGGGMGATATAVLTDGQVTQIRVMNGGCCYTNLPTIVIDSPPRIPTVAIRVSKVIVTQNVDQGQRYVLESSSDMITWTATGPPFIAPADTIQDEFDISVTGRFFRLRQVP